MFEIKDVLNFFHGKEIRLFGAIDVNYKKYDAIKCEFLKYFIAEIIEDKYQYNECLTKMRIIIKNKINEIIEEINSCKDIFKYDLSKSYMKKFKTEKMPKFLEKNILDIYNEKKLINEFTNSSNKENFVDNNGDLIEIGDSLIEAYFKLLNKHSKAFESGNKKLIFEILLYSNLKDIYKNPKIKVIFKDNFETIIRLLNLNYNEEKEKFEKIINNRIEMKLVINKLEDVYKNYEINDSHLFIIASFFYLVMNIIKDKNMENNLINPLLNKILKNILYCLI